MELRHLLTFKTIVEKGGFKKAADELGYAQSSVTNHIKDLEDELNQPLFDRLGKKVVLTTFGKEFFPYATKIIDLYTEVKEKATHHDEPSGNLRIGAFDHLTSYRLPQILVEYKRKYPNVNLSISSIDFHNLHSELQNGTIDLALILETKEWTPKELTVQPIKHEPMVLISPPTEQDTDPTRTVLYTEKTCAYKSLFDRYIDQQSLEIQGSVEFGNIEAIKRCVMSGLGSSMLPYFTVKNEIDQHAFKGNIIEDPAYQITTFVAYHKDKWISPAIDSMISLIEDHAEHWD
ncbi:LysR family transcriptional regulator [Rossellomorea marisflavi]|uniref:LysR family transcriptional regulator n=1 Tax=Rossellomorea marisflavi TaxID=189381 RepID=UPI001EE2875A|nr:LysR family transcriptional regulator [Rossellomorea marisflavi]UKS66085.1 LysR family transcriptional regulator [Rossellomorea marisflavi]